MPSHSGSGLRSPIARLFTTLTFVALLMAACSGSTGSATDTPDPGAAPTATPGPTPTATALASAAVINPTIEPTAATPTATMAAPEPTAPPEPIAPRVLGDGPVVDPASRATLVGTRCGFELPPGTEPACYTLTVPENWIDESAEQQVELPIAVFPATGAEATGDPLIYLEGGPGGHALELISRGYNSFFSELAIDRDLIVFDQRGTGFSTPRLNCGQIDSLIRDEPLTLKPAEEETAAFIDATADCAEQLRDQGIDISQYNSAASATDMEALRVLLGYDSWNLLGTSYGTRLAQTSMRLYPDDIRSAILDAVVPNADDRPSIFAPNAERAFRTMFDGCAADAGCAERYPDFEERFFAIVDAWDAEPVSFSGLNPLTLDAYEFQYNGTDLLDTTFGALYSRANLAVIPQVIEEAEAGRFTIISTLASLDLAQQGFITRGMFIAVACAEEDPFSDESLVAEQAPDNPYFARFADDYASFYGVCDAWAADPVGAAENELVTSDLPTLLMAGQYDPITPPSGSTAVAAGLANSYSVEFPHEGHGTVITSCGLQIARDFLADPNSAPDTSCVDSTPAPSWTTDPDQPITLVDFEVDVAAISARSVRPSQWQDQGNGVFARYNTVADPALLLVQNTFGLGPGTVLAFFAEPLSWDGVPEFSETRTIDDRTWDIYFGEVGASTVIAGISDEGRDSIVVLVSGDPTDFPRFIDDVFEPALDALTPL